MQNPYLCLQQPAVVHIKKKHLKYLNLLLHFDGGLNVNRIYRNTIFYLSNKELYTYFRRRYASVMKEIIFRNAQVIIFDIAIMFLNDFYLRCSPINKVFY